jgi:glycerate kinase
LGFGLLAFLSAQLHPGFEWFAEKAGLEDRLRSADLVITGEGAIDASTLMGKGVGQIGQRCRARGLPCIALAGRVDLKEPGGGVFTECHALTALTTLEGAATDAADWLERLASATAAGLRPRPAQHRPS